MFYFCDGVREFWKKNEEAHFSIIPDVRSFGAAVFENCRTYGDHIFCLDEHLERLENSARVLNLEINFSLKKIQEKAQEVFEKSKASQRDFTIRLFLTETFFYIHTEPITLPNPEIYRQGVKIVDAVFERSFAEAKYPSPAYAFFEKSKPPGVFETIFFNESGLLREGNISNVFVVFEKKTDKTSSLVMATPENKILLGVTRKRVLDLAQKLGFEIELRDITREEIIQGAKELFLTNTSKEIVPIRQWHGWRGENFEVSSVLRAKFLAER